MNLKVVMSSRWILAAALVAGCLTAAASEEPVQAERVAVGQQAPPVSLTGTDGETYVLADLKGEKNLVLIFFRGSW